MNAFSVPKSSLSFLMACLVSSLVTGSLALAELSPQVAPQVAPQPAPEPVPAETPQAQIAAPPAASAPSAVATNLGKDLIVDRVDIQGGVVHFRYAESNSKAPGPVRTGIVDLMSIGPIKRSAGEMPYFIFTGLPCKDCRDSPNIYILRPDGRKPNSFIYPGKIVDPDNGAVLLQSRAFYGRCLRGVSSEIYVVFQQERVDRRRSLQASVFVAEPGPDHLLERLIERRFPRIDDTLRLVRQKTCQEIPGKNRTMLKKLLDLRPKRDPEKVDEENTEDDAPPKENQTDRDLSPPQTET